MTGMELLLALDHADPAYVQQAEETVRRPRRGGMLLLAARRKQEFLKMLS